LFALLLLMLLVAVATINYFFTDWFLQYAKENQITDIPNKRSSHDVPTPRGGGVGFVIISILASIVYLILQPELISSGLITFLIVLTVVAVFGWFDDKKSLSVPIRFSVQIFAAGMVLLFISGLDTFYIPNVDEISMGTIGFVAGIVWLTGTTNIYNFMDGVDGIASVQAIFAGIGWAFFGWYLEIPFVFIANIILVSAIISFLFYNWAPAKIFMGDVGSIFLGFYFASMPFLADYLSDAIDIGLAIWIAALLLWPFLYDGSFTLIRRFIKGKNVFKPHRTHLYQRLNRQGWEHQQVALFYAFMCTICLMASFAFFFGSSAFKISLITVLFLVSFYFSHWVFKRRRSIKAKRTTREQG
jgi:Fuc2NAc and GlcNAc transferase